MSTLIGTLEIVPKTLESKLDQLEIRESWKCTDHGVVGVDEDTEEGAGDFRVFAVILSSVMTTRHMVWTRNCINHNNNNYKRYWNSCWI